MVENEHRSVEDLDDSTNLGVGHGELRRNIGRSSTYANESTTEEEEEERNARLLVGSCLTRVGLRNGAFGCCPRQ
jgi:hypothetical protein